MRQNDAIGQNELVVNDLLIRIYKVVLLFLPVIFILKAANLFDTTWIFAAAFAAGGLAACLIPIACGQLRINVRKQKNINVICSVLLTFIVYGLFHLNAALMLLIPVCFACLYFDIKLIKKAGALTIPVLAAAELFNTCYHVSFSISGYGAYFRAAAFFIQIVILAALCISIVRRAERMLQGTHSFYENIDDLFSNAHAASQSLQLSGENLVKTLEDMEAEQAKGDGNASKYTDAAYGLPSSENVERLVSNLNQTMENVRELMKYTYAITQTKPEKKEYEENIRSYRSNIEEYTRKSKQVLTELGRYMEKIKDDLGMMAVIIEESRKLSADAKVEAEDVNKSGDGSVILGLKVEALADESYRSAVHIQQVLDGIANDAGNTVAAITKAYEETVKELELINRTVETLIQWLMYKNMQ